MGQEVWALLGAHLAYVHVILPYTQSLHIIKHRMYRDDRLTNAL